MNWKVQVGFTPPSFGARTARKTGKSAAPTRIASATRNRDSVQITYADVQSAREEGYIAIRGQKYAVSEELSREIAEVYERVSAQNYASALRDMVEQNAEATKQQIEALSKQAKAMAKAMEIYRRIASGGRVPPEDERFLQEFSPELYAAAKMAALMAKEHKDYDSVLEDEEETPGDGDASTDEDGGTKQGVAVSVSDDGAPTVESVSAAEVDASAPV